MSLSSVAERFFFVFTHPPGPSPIPSLPPIPPVAFRNRVSSDTQQKCLQDPVWDEGGQHYTCLRGNTSPAFS